MRIGLPREIKSGEARVALRPLDVSALIHAGHAVVVEHAAGTASGYDDAQYEAAGAHLTEAHAMAFDVDLVVKVKELQRVEYPLVRDGSILLGFQQFAIEPAYLEAAIASGASFVACETIEDDDPDATDRLPVLAAMSRVAGRIAIGLAARHLRGDDAASLEGVAAIVIGAGAAGGAAARDAARRGAAVTVLAASTRRFAALSRDTAAIATELFDAGRLRAALPATQLLVGAVLVAGRTSPRLVDRAMIAAMPMGSLFIDIGIDQRGIAETSRMTRLDDPFFVVDGVTHCGVPNLPALEPRVASDAYATTLAPFVGRIAAQGLEGLREAPGLARGLQVHRGAIVDPRLAADTQHRPRRVAK